MQDAWLVRSRRVPRPSRVGVPGCLCGHIRQPDPGRGHRASSSTADGTSQRTHLAGVDARHSTYHRNRCRRRSRSYCQPERAHGKTAPTPRARVTSTPRECEPRPRWSMRAAPRRSGLRAQCASAPPPRHDRTLSPGAAAGGRSVPRRFEFSNLLVVSRY